mgnify:FL=1|tara:strand:+ start:88 stop:456 length:369 start_codon:yes stop_codon:yes gene_type:complete
MKKNETPNANTRLDRDLTEREKKNRDAIRLIVTQGPAIAASAITRGASKPLQMTLQGLLTACGDMAQNKDKKGKKTVENGVASGITHVIASAATPIKGIQVIKDMVAGVGSRAYINKKNKEE